jgi:membrane protein
MLEAFRVPLSWAEIFKRTAREVLADNCLGLAAQLAYYFFLALFPALLFFVALLSFIPIAGLMDAVNATLARVTPSREVYDIIHDQIVRIAGDKNGGLLTIGVLGAIWSTSAGVGAIIETLNTAYDIQEGRPWWKVRLTSLGLTVALAVFIVLSFVLLIAGPVLAERVAVWMHVGPAFVWAWKVLQWPVVFGLVAFGVAIIYYYAPDARQEWIWITPGSVLATLLWLVISLAFRFYVQHVTSYDAAYGAIGGVIVLLLWFYVSALAVLVGAELNAEIEHASPLGKDPGEKYAGEKARMRSLERSGAAPAGMLKPALTHMNCDVDVDLPAAAPASASLSKVGEAPRIAGGAPAARRAPRSSDWILSGLVLGQAAVLTYARLRSRFKRIRG